LILYTDIIIVIKLFDRLVNLAAQFDKTTGLVRAEDAYLKAAGSLSYALAVFTGPDKGKALLESMHQTVIQRIQKIQVIKGMSCYY
jgi:hypothetical protein